VHLHGQLPAQLTAGACFGMLCAPDDAGDGNRGNKHNRRQFVAAAAQYGSFDIVFKALQSAVQVRTLNVCRCIYMSDNR